MAHHVFRSQVRKVNILHVAQDAAHDAQAGDLAMREIHLGDVAGDHDLGAKAQAGEEHLHLRGRGVLGLIKDDKRIVQCAAAHIGQRSDLDDAGLHELRDHLWIEHVPQGVV